MMQICGSQQVIACSNCLLQSHRCLYCCEHSNFKMKFFPGHFDEINMLFLLCGSFSSPNILKSFFFNLKKKEKTKKKKEKKDLL